jgi:hypothetical protein
LPPEDGRRALLLAVGRRRYDLTVIVTTSAPVRVRSCQRDAVAFRPVDAHVGNV